MWLFSTFITIKIYILLLILFVTDENAPKKGLLSKVFQPELNNFTIPHPSADVMEPLDNLAQPAGMNQASENETENETEIAVIHAPSQRSGEESSHLSSNDPSNQDNYTQINTVGTVGTVV